MRFQSITLSVLVGLLCVRCGSDTGAGGPTTLEGLPKATGAVTSSAISRGAVGLQSASAGVLLTAAATATFAGKSRVMCEMVQMVKSVVREAANPDKIQCYVGVMEKHGAFTGSYDGAYKYYEISGAGDQGGAMKIKFKSAKAADGTVNAFEMFNCQGSSQSEYVSTTITGGTAALTVASVHSSSESGVTYSGSQRVTVAGNYSGSSWIGEKTIISQTVGSSSGNPGGDFTDSRYTTLVQGPSSLTVTGSGSGTYGGYAHQVLMQSIMQGIAMGNLATFAVGDGSGKGSFRFNGSDHSGIASWDGDTKLNLSDATGGDYYATVNAATLPTLTTPDTSFQTGETWNCAAEGSFTSVNFASLEGNAAFVADFQTCDTNYGFGDDHAWIECPHSGD